VYPGVLARCEQCMYGSYDFSKVLADAAGLGSDGLNKRQYRYISGTMASTLPGTLSLSRTSRRHGLRQRIHARCRHRP